MTAGCHRVQLKPEGREPKAGLGAVYAKGPDGFAITVEPGAHGLGPRGSVWHCAGPSGEELNVMENTNGQVRRRGPERILVAATLAAVAMLGCSDDNGGTLNPTAPSAVNAPPTASSASTASLVSAVATPTSAGAEAAFVRGSDHGRQQHDVDTGTQRRDNPYAPNRQLPPGSVRPRRESFRRPASLQQADRQQASPCETSLLGHRRQHRSLRHQGETSESSVAVRPKGSPASGNSR